MSESYNEDIIEDSPAPPSGDVEMTEGGAAAETAAEGGDAPANKDELPFAEESADSPPPPRVTFLQYLSSPIVTLIVGTGDQEAVLTAHQSLLIQSSWFAEACADFTDDGTVRFRHFIPNPPEQKAN